MSSLQTVAVVLCAVWIAFSAFSTFTKQAWAVDNFREYGVPEGWWPWLGTAKLLGALGLVAGLVVPAVGVAAAIALVVYFVGAMVTVVRARYYAHLLFPLLYLAPAAAAGLLIANA